MKRLIIPTITMIIVLACGTAAPTQPSVDLGAIQTSAVQTALAAIQPTTPPLATDVPATEPPASNTNLTGQFLAWNYVAMQESGGLKVEIARFVLADKTAIDDDFTANGTVTIYDDRPVVAEILFRITNTTNTIISIYPDQGKLIAGGEQIELFDFAILGEFGDTFSGEIHPGVTVIGGIWVGFKRTPVDQITSATIAFSGPSDANFNVLGPDFNIVLDLSQRKFEPIPDELK